MIKAVIFDMDGIIIDSEPLQMIAINQVMAQWNVKLSVQEFQKMIGRKLADDFADMKKEYNILVDYSTFAKQKREAYHSILENNLVEMPGLSPLLSRLLNAKYRLAVASSSVRADVDMVLNGLSIADKFAVVASGDEVEEGKPNPALFLLAANRLNVPVTECVAIEDSNPGLRAAKDSGMKCIVVPHQHTQHQDFARADIIVDSLNDITVSLIRSL
ncbi:MAG: HAD family phosphatase [bacterium]|nr:HAD family phosphatase [bacterium]